MRQSHAKLINESAKEILTTIFDAMVDETIDQYSALKLIEMRAMVIKTLIEKELADGQIEWPAEEKSSTT